MTDPSTAPSVGGTGSAAPAPSTHRRLVVIELEGGNDGLDTVVPYKDGRYLELRRQVGVAPETVLELDDDVGLNPNLAGLHGAGLAVIEGVGMAEPDLSHFESARRWWRGDMTGTATTTTGFLGRLCDQLEGDEPVTGLSLGRGLSPAIRSEQAVTLGIQDPAATGGLLSGDERLVHARDLLANLSLTADEDRPLHVLAREHMGRALDFLDVVEDLPEVESAEYPGSQLGRLLRTTARLIAAGSGVRVVHIPWGSFDTHNNHRSAHDRHLGELDAAVTAFLTELAALGLADTTLVATTSEFGRRPAASGNGTDHGTASSMLLAGPVTPGRHGETPSLRDLDANDNLVATVGMDEYYATLSEAWFGVPATAVLANSPAPLPDLVA